MFGLFKKKSEKEKLQEQYAKFSFEPIIGETYHLYKKENVESFLSIIAPDQCSFNTLGSFYLNADQIWKKTGQF